MPLTRILLVRHGETDWNRDGRVMGALAVPLNDRGERQARQLAAFLQSRPVDSVYSSPVLRAQQTATILATTMQRSVQIEPGLTEIGMGEWEGKYWKELADDLTRQNLYLMPDEVRPPGGETLREVQTRAVASIEGARDHVESRNILFVSHADVVRAIVAHFMSFELRRIRQVRIDHASLTTIELDSGLADLLHLNYVPVSGPLA